MPHDVTTAQQSGTVARTVLLLVLGRSYSTKVRVDNKTRTPGREELDLLRNPWLLDRPYLCPENPDRSGRKGAESVALIRRRQGV